MQQKVVLEPALKDISIHAARIRDIVVSVWNFSNSKVFINSTFLLKDYTGDGIPSCIDTAQYSYLLLFPEDSAYTIGIDASGP